MQTRLYVSTQTKILCFSKTKIKIFMTGTKTLRFFMTGTKAFSQVQYQKQDLTLFSRLI